MMAVMSDEAAPRVEAARRASHSNSREHSPTTAYSPYGHVMASDEAVLGAAAALDRAHEDGVRKCVPAYCACLKKGRAVVLGFWFFVFVVGVVRDCAPPLLLLPPLPVLLLAVRLPAQLRPPRCYCYHYYYSYSLATLSLSLSLRCGERGS